MKQSSFICLNCNHETKVSKGRSSLLCQRCGCADIKFTTPIVIYPIIPGNELGPKIEVKMGDPVLGKHKYGFVWQTEPIDFEVTAPPEMGPKNGIKKGEKLRKALSKTEKEK